MKEIKYINRDFASFKQTLIDFAKNYFPNTYNDFNNDADPGNMFIELASYVGDVLSFYTDKQVQEVFPQFATDLNNMMSMAYTLGYRPKVTAASTVTLDVYQLIPAKVTGGISSPDYSYALIIAKDAKIKSNSNSNNIFITQDVVDFSFSSSSDPITVSVYQVNGTTNQPEYYLLNKKVKAVSGDIKSTSFSFGSPQKFSTVTISDSNIIRILDVIDSDGNKWYEVPYLAQNTVYEEVQNNSLNEPALFSYNNQVPYVLRMRKEQRRFTTRFNSNLNLDIEFGSGITGYPDEQIIPNTDNIGMGLPDSLSMMNTAFDPVNFLYTKDYGLAPSNTTLTVRYLSGGGVTSNAPSNDINSPYEINASSAYINPSSLNAGVLQYCIRSLAFNNELPATGGGDGDSVDDIRIRTMASFPTQLRAVSKDDYIIRTLSLPSKFGVISKVYVTQEDYNVQSFASGNPLAINLYVLSYNADKKLTYPSYALKKNLATYLSQFNMLNDGITIKDGYYINIGLNFDISVLPSFNSREVLSDCLSQLKNYFNIDNFQINQPILLSEVYKLLTNVKGVQNVVKLEVTNKQGEDSGYSKYGYDIVGATKNNVIYPSKDPCVFEVRYPDNDIKGRIVNI
jgi:hypothetical protein